MKSNTEQAAVWTMLSLGIMILRSCAIPQCRDHALFHVSPHPRFIFFCQCIIFHLFSHPTLCFTRFPLTLNIHTMVFRFFTTHDRPFVSWLNFHHLYKYTKIIKLTILTYTLILSSLENINKKY